MPKMVNNYVSNVPFYQEPQRKLSVRGAPGATIPGVSIGPTSSEHLRKIFVGGLSTHTTVQTVREFFAQFGEVADAIVMRDPVSNRSRGFGFITFVEPGAVDNVQHARPHVIDNKAVETKRALPRNDANKTIGQLGDIKSTKIFLGGLKDCHDEDSIREHFSQFGKIVSIKLLLDKETGRKRGFGFLEYEDMVSAERALIQGKQSINFAVVEVKKSTQKQDPGKRLRQPVGGAARAGYAPPQPATMDNFNYSPAYNPYVAQSALPPSAFINGWASYVTPTVPAAAPMYLQPPLHSYAGYAQESFGNFKYGAPDWPKNQYKSSELLKPGYKHAHTSTNDRPRNEYKSVQAAAAQQQKLSSVLANAEPQLEAAGAAGGGDVAKKWPTENYKVFKPSANFHAGAQKQPQGHVQTNRMNSYNNDGPTPAYGI